MTTRGWLDLAGTNMNEVLGERIKAVLAAGLASERDTRKSMFF